MADQVVVVNAQEWTRLPTKLLATLWEVSGADWGCRFVSRETGEELSLPHLLGLFGPDFQQTMMDGLTPFERKKREEFAEPAYPPGEQEFRVHLRDCSRCMVIG